MDSNPSGNAIRDYVVRQYIFIDQSKLLDLSS